MITEQDVIRIVKDYVNNTPVGRHQHTGIDSPIVDGTDIGSFQILNFHPTTATWPKGRPQATFVLSESGGTRRLSTMINNSLRYVVLT